MRKIIDLTGQRFTKLTAIKPISRNKSGNYIWLCKCDCGQEKNIVGTNLTRKIGTKSCGCVAIEKTIQRNKINNRLYKNCWTQEEDNILKKYYSNNGSFYCSKLLKRTKASIVTRAMKLNLKTIIATSGLPQKFIIKKIAKNKVVSICKIHGEAEHYYYNNHIGYCLICSRIKDAKHRKIPINKFTDRLRSSINIAFRKVSGPNYIPRGGFRNLDYSPRDLYNYLESIRQLQNNKCPHCNTSYDKCKISIDHVIPLATAKTEQQVIDLFDLKNLNLMCKNCNSSKKDTDYNIWMDS